MAHLNPYDTCFASVDELTTQAESVLQRRDSQVNYVIFFTPRSGSTWLGDLIVSTKVAGEPREWFNPQYIKKSVAHFGSVTPPKYAEILRRYRQINTVFGLEITYNQYRLLKKHLDVLTAFPKSKIIYLRRMNLILQAISLYRAVESSVFHVKSSDVPAVKVSYDSEKITQCYNRILRQEWHLEQLFARRQTRPLRITYESLAENPESVIAEILFFVQGDKQLPLCNINSLHQKVGSEESLEWAQRFRSENENFVRHWNFFRGQRRPQ